MPASVTVAILAEDLLDLLDALEVLDSAADLARPFHEELLELARTELVALYAVARISGGPVVDLIESPSAVPPQPPPPREPCHGNTPRAKGDRS